MCGIVGSIGSNKSISIVMEGLKRLEYRGYDSAGISFVQNNSLVVLKKKGKLQNLADLINEQGLPTSNMAIGHTRWATHGEPSDVNAHPHITEKSSENIALVHNGIIENCAKLKNEVADKLISDTDTEIFLRLIEKALVSSNLKDAILTSFKKIVGNSAFLIMDEKSKTLWAIKRAAPLVAGQKENNFFVSSDPYALVGFADTLYFPEDEVLIKIEKGKLSFFDINGESTKKYLRREHSDELAVNDKENFDHYMIKEIYEQPKLITNLLDFYTTSGKKQLLEAAAFKPNIIYIVACGTARHAGLVIARYMEQALKKVVIVRLASEFRYQEPPITTNDLAIFISQSGETADTLAAAKLCKDRNIKTISIVNVEESLLYRMTDHKLLTMAGREIGVASTKAFTLQVLTGYFYLTALLGHDLNELRPKLEILANDISEVLTHAKKIEDIAAKVYLNNEFLFTGRQILYPIALEGALKLKEISYVHAEGYAAGELKHGPIALVDEKTVNIALITEQLFEKTLIGIKEVKARRGIVVSVGVYNKQIESNYHIEAKSSNQFGALTINVALQLFAYYIAKNKGTDIDKPRNLAKSVTVE